VHSTPGTGFHPEQVNKNITTPSKIINMRLISDFISESRAANKTLTFGKKDQVSERAVAAIKTNISEETCQSDGRYELAAITSMERRKTHNVRISSPRKNHLKKIPTLFRNSFILISFRF